MPRTKENTPPPRVSVLMANYNGERFLGEAVESILSQSFTDFELIVVDDGSTDRSVSLLSSYASGDKRIRAFYFPQNRGFVSALNYGLGFAQGEYVARMDSDDSCHRDRLLRQVSYLDKHRKVHILGCRYRAIDEAGAFCSDADAWRFRGTIVLPRGRRRIAKRVLLGHYHVLHPTIVCRRSTLASIGGYRDFFPISEDNDLYLRLVNLHGAVLDNLSEKLFYYRHYDNSVTQRFDHSTHMLIVRVLALSSEFCRRGFWDPLEPPPLKNCKSLRYRGVSSFLYLQDSLDYLPSYPRARLYHLLRVVMILRRFGLKKFHRISLWNDWGLTLPQQFCFYLYFCIACFRLRKFRAGFMYLRYIIKMRHDVLFVSCAQSLMKLFVKKTFGNDPNAFVNREYHLAQRLDKQKRIQSRLRASRSLVFTRHWPYGLRHLFFSFCISPSYTIKFVVYRFFSYFTSIFSFPFRKLGR